jgi:hypothetical protein
LFTGFALVAEGRFVSADFGVSETAVDFGVSETAAESGGFGGVLDADFLGGGVFFAVAGFGESLLRVLMLVHGDRNVNSFSD